MDDKSITKFKSFWKAVLFLALAAAPSAEGVQSLALAWNMSTADGVAGYHIYYGTDGTNFEYMVDAGANTNYTLTGLQEGQTNTIVVTAYDGQGVESQPSNLITFIVPGIVNITPPSGLRSPAVISFPVAPGHTYQVQASIDLTTWSTLWQTTATNNAWTQFEDVEAANLKMRFYRLLWQ